MKPYTLTNREGESISPMTSTRTVFDKRGVDLDTLLAQQQRDLENALKEYPKKTEVGQSLAGKQAALSTTTDLHITDDNIIGLTEAADLRLFCRLFSAAAGVHGYARMTEGKFDCELNRLRLTLEEAVAVYEAGAIGTYACAGFYRRPVSGPLLRTNLPRRIASQWGYLTQGFDAHNFFRGMEVLNLEPYWGEDPNGFLVDPRLNGTQVTGNFMSFADDEWYGGNRLKRIIGVINLALIRPQYHFSALTFCHVLEEVRISNCGCNLRLTTCRMLSLGSLQYLVEHAAGTSPITVTVHADVFAKLTGDTSNGAAAAVAADEAAQWRLLVAAAAERQITFATA